MLINVFKNVSNVEGVNFYFLGFNAVAIANKYFVEVVVVRIIMVILPI